MTSSNSKVQKIQKQFQTLSELATSLNSASDELTRSVAVLDDSLKQLNVGLSAWVTFRSRPDETDPDLYDHDQIGYCKVNGVWGIALQNVWGDPTTERHFSEGPWLFKDASREMRINSVGMIPDLVEELVREAFAITKRIQEKSKEVRELAEAINPIAAQAGAASPSVSQRGDSPGGVPLSSLVRAK